MKNQKKTIIIINVILAVFIVAEFSLILHVHKNKSYNVVTTQKCNSKALVLNQTGKCVSDLQTLVNYLETEGLNQCSFNGGKTLILNGNFDQLTQDQVKVIQNWLNCYNKQEGITNLLSVTGSVDLSTWSYLCTYSYTYPSEAGQNISPFYKSTLVAGKDAGCN